MTSKTDIPARRGLIRRTARKLRSRLKRGVSFGRWLLADVPRAPGLEIYAERRARMARTLARQARQETGEMAYEAARIAQVPRTVWIFWAQGEAAAPYLVRRCIESWQTENPGWQIRVLDADAAADLVDLSDIPDFMPLRVRANLLRMRLLKAHGGVWADATLLCHRPLDEWLPLHTLSGFFVFANPGPDRLVTNWFIASEPEGYLIAAWEKVYSRYITKCRAMPRGYFMQHYTLQWQMARDSHLREAWDRTAHLPAPPAFALMTALTGGLSLETPREMIRAGFPVSKLSHKARISDEKVDAALETVAG